MQSNRALGSNAGGIRHRDIPATRGVLGKGQLGGHSGARFPDRRLLLGVRHYVLIHAAKKTRFGTPAIRGESGIARALALRRGTNSSAPRQTEANVDHLAKNAGYHLAMGVRDRPHPPMMRRRRRGQNPATAIASSARELGSGTGAAIISCELKTRFGSCCAL